VLCTVPLLNWVVVVVFELAAGAIATGVIATAGGLVVSYCRVVVVSVT
jgi:hypothetical protein